MFGKTIVTSLLAAVMILAAGVAMADTFGTGGNQFTINFVPISGHEPIERDSGGRWLHFYRRRQQLPHGHLRGHQRPVEQVHSRLRHAGDGLR